MKVEPAGVDDAAAIAAVHVRSWQVAYAPFLDAGFLRTIDVEQRSTSWRRAIESGACRLFVARVGQQVVGFVSCGRCRDAGAGETAGEVWALYALDTVWGQGVGRALLDAALQSLREAGFAQCSLWVLAANARGRRFYRSAGFAEVPESSQWFELGGQRVEELLCRRSLLE